MSSICGSRRAVARLVDYLRIVSPVAGNLAIETCAARQDQPATSLVQLQKHSPSEKLAVGRVQEPDAIGKTFGGKPKFAKQGWNQIRSATTGAHSLSPGQGLEGGSTTAELPPEHTSEAEVPQMGEFTGGGREEAQDTQAGEPSSEAPGHAASEAPQGARPASSSLDLGKAQKELAEAKQEVAGKNLKDLNKLMSQCVSRGDHLRAQLLFDAWSSLPDNEPSVLTYNFLLHAMVRSGARHESLLAVVAAMEGRGLEPNMLTFNSLLRAAFRERDSYKAEKIIARMEASGPDALPDADSYNLVVALCSLDRRVGAALTHMQSMLRRGFVPTKSTYNEVLMACARMRRSRDAIAVLKELQAQSISPMPGTLGELLSASTEAEDPECCLLVLQMIAQRTLVSDEGGLLLALNLAARAANPPLAEQAWALLGGALQGRKALPPFHLARIHSYSAAADFTSAFRSVRELEEAWGAAAEGSPAEPELLCPLTSLQPLTLALSRGVGVLDNAYFKLADMHAGGELVSLAALNCVIAGCSSIRDTERAQQTFEEISRTFELSPNAHSFNALLDGYGKTRQAGRAEQLVADMKDRGVLPTGRTYHLLASSFIVGMDARKATEAVQAMVEAGHVPSRELLIHLFRRSKRSPFQPGIDYAVKLITQIGYRHASGGEVKRRNILLEMAGSSHNPRPMRRERSASSNGDLEDGRWHDEQRAQQQFQGW